MSRISRLSVSHDLIVTMMSQGLIMLQGLLVTPLIVKWAGPHSYGAYVLLANFISTSFSILTTMQYLYRRRLVSAETIAERRSLINTEITFHLLGLAMLAAIIWLMGDDIQRLLVDGQVVVDRWVLIGLLGTTFLAKQTQDYYRFTFRFRIFNFLSVASIYVFLASVSAWVLTSHLLSVESLFLLQIVVNLALSLPFAVAMLKELGVPRLGMSPSAVIGEVRANLQFVMEMMVDFALGFSDRYLISLFLSVAAVASYQPAYQLASLSLFVPRFAGVLLVPIVSKLIDSGQRYEAEEKLESYLSLFLMGALPFSVGALMLGGPIVALLTTREIALQAEWVPALVALASILYGIMLMMDPVILALGRNRLAVIAYAVGACVNVALNIILLPLFRDVHVAGVTTLIGYTASCLLLWLLLRPHWRFSLVGIGLPRYLAATAVMGVALLALRYAVGTFFSLGILAICGVVCFGALIYFSTFLALGGFDRRIAI